MKLRLRQIEVFHAVMLTGSVSDAARLLNVSQPAVSRIVAHTEDVLKLKLFHRKKGRLSPTGEAEKLYMMVKEFYDQALRVDEFAQGLGSGQTGRLSVCSSPSLGQFLIPAALTEFSRRMPKAAIEFYTRLIADIPNDILTRRADLAISITPIEHPNLVCQPLTTGRMVCALPRGHPLCTNDVITLKHLEKIPLVMHRAGVSFGTLIRQAFERARIEYSVCATVLQTETACALVQSGMAPSIVDEFTVSGRQWPDMIIKPLQEDIILRPSVVYSVFDEPTMLSRRLVDIIRKTIVDSQSKGQRLL